MTEKQMVTPREVARRWGISVHKVLTWIRTSELRAVDASTNQGKRPRYLIDESDLAAFARSRANVDTQPTTRRRKVKA